MQRLFESQIVNEVGDAAQRLCQCIAAAAARIPSDEGDAHAGPLYGNDSVRWPACCTKAVKCSPGAVRKVRSRACSEPRAIHARSTWLLLFWRRKSRRLSVWAPFGKVMR